MLNLLDSWFKIDLGEAAFYAVFGLVFVFLGIVLLVAIFMLIGLAMKKVNERKAKKTSEKANANPAVPEVEAGIPPEVVAAITAAIAVYTEGEMQKCDFVVRRIKRL